MSADEKDRFIQYLVDKVNMFELKDRATELAVEEFQSTFDSVSASLESLKKEMEDIKAELREERSKRKKAEAKARKLDQQLKYAQKNKFGDKRQNAGKDEKREDSADREDEKGKFDGTEGTVSTKSVQATPIEEHPEKEKKERDTSNRPEKYDTMSVEGAPVFYPTDDSKVPGRIMVRKLVKVFSFKMCLVEEHYEMVHYVEPGKKPKWGYFPTEGHPDVVMKFEVTKATPEFLQALAYEVYVKNVTFGLMHHWLTDMWMMIRLRSRLDIELAKEETERSPYLTESLNCLKKFWDGIFAYHSVISTVKLHGMSCWGYLGKFFKNIFNGYRDFFSLTPANIGMAYANC